MIKTTTKEWYGLPKGTQLRLTGKVNGVPASECVRVGYFETGTNYKESRKSAYQHDDDGQIMWIRNDILEDITNDES